MSNADERLDTIKRENRCNPDEMVSFLLEEIEHRESQIESLVDELSKQMVSVPMFVENIKSEYGIE